MKKFLEKIFSIKKSKNRKEITFLGIKYKIKTADLTDINEKINFIFEHTLTPEKIPPAQGYLRLVQSVNFEILCKFDEICKKHNINYWLFGGTLLGAVRHKGFIPWDDDLDLGMLGSDYEKFCSIIDKELENTDFVFKIVPSHIGKILHKNFMPQNSQEWIDFVKWSKGKKLFMALDIFPFYYLDENISQKSAGEKINKFFKNKKLMYKKYKKLEEYEKIKILTDNTNNELKTTKPTPMLFQGLECITPEPAFFATDYIFPLQELTFENRKFLAPNNYKNVLRICYDDYMKIKIYPAHLNFDNICKDDKIRLLNHLTIEEKTEQSLKTRMPVERDRERERERE